MEDQTQGQQPENSSVPSEPTPISTPARVVKASGVSTNHSLVEIALAIAILGGLTIWHFSKSPDKPAPKSKEVQTVHVAQPKPVKAEQPVATEPKKPSKAEVKATRRATKHDHSYNGPFVS